MPELVSRYPEVTQQVLKSAGAVCGEGAAVKILTRCPSERFCSLPGGEFCVYGLDGISHMTQISVREWKNAACPGGASQRGSVVEAGTEWAALGAVFVTGLVLGRFWRRFGTGRRQGR